MVYGLALSTGGFAFRGHLGHMLTWHGRKTSESSMQGLRNCTRPRKGSSADGMKM